VAALKTYKTVLILGKTKLVVSAGGLAGDCAGAMGAEVWGCLSQEL